MKEELIKKFYQGLIFNSIAALIFLIIVIVLVFARNKFLIRFQYSGTSKIIFFAITLFFFLISGIFAVKTSLYLKDYNSFKNEDFNTITGLNLKTGARMRKSAPPMYMTQTADSDSSTKMVFVTNLSMMIWTESKA